MEYYLQLALCVDSKIKDDAWEQVDQYTYDHWANALNNEDAPRYSGVRFCRNSDGISIHGEALTSRDLAIICRILNVRDHDAPGSVAGGFFKTPEYIKFQMKNKVVLHEMNGENYNLKKAV